MLRDTRELAANAVKAANAYIRIVDAINDAEAAAKAALNSSREAEDGVSYSSFEMQTDMGILSRVSTKYLQLMQLYDKCKAMTISRKRAPTKLDCLFGHTKLAKKQELEILGITIVNKLTWTKHISNIFWRAGQ